MVIPFRKLYPINQSWLDGLRHWVMRTNRDEFLGLPPECCLLNRVDVTTQRQGRWFDANILVLVKLGGFRIAMLDGGVRRYMPLYESMDFGVMDLGWVDVDQGACNV